MAVNQTTSQSQNSSKNQSGSNSSAKPHSQSSSSQSTSGSTSGSTTTSAVNASSSNASASGSGDMIEQTIAKGVSHLMHTLEPQLNRIGTQIVNRAMSRGQNIADTGVKRMQDQPWYMVGGALALVAVGVGLLFAFEGSTNSPEFRSDVQ